MNILILNPNYIKRHNWGHQLFKNEFGKHHDVVYYGQGYPKYNAALTVPEILKQFNKKFDIILTYEIKYSRFFKGLGKIRDIPKVHIQIDYAINIKNYPGFADTKNIDKLINRNKPDLIFATSMSNVEVLKDHLGIDKVFILPFSVDTNIYKDMGLKRSVDVMAVFSTNTRVYSQRNKVQQLIQKMNINGFTGHATHQAYIKKINQSKIFVISNNINKRLSMKYTEAMACGALVLSDRPEDFELQGFIAGKHLVLYNNMADMQKKIRYYLKHKDERIKIAKCGMEFVREHHSCAKRVRQFTKIVNRELII